MSKRTRITDERLEAQYATRAARSLALGNIVRIAPSGCITVTRAEDGTKYVFEGDGAADLLRSVPQWINPTAYLLAICRDWR